MPAIFLNILRMCLLALWVLLGGLAAVHAESASEPVSSGTVEKLQDRVIELEKETAVLKAELGAKIDAQDKRIADGIGLHGAQVTMLSNQTSMLGDQTAELGNLIQNFAIGIAVLGLIGGFFAFKRAEQIAKEQSEKWFAENDGKLRKEIDGLAARAQQACDAIDKHRDGVLAVSEEVEQLSAELKAKIGNFSVEGLDVSEKREMRLENKPRSEWTAADFGSYGYFLFQNKQFEDALLALDEQVERLDGSTYSEDKLMLATALLNKGDLLVKLGRLQEAIGTYDDVVQRIDGFSEQGFNERLARAMVHKGGALSKQQQFEAAIVAYDEMVQRFEMSKSSELFEWVVTALGGKATNLVQLGRLAEAREVLGELLQLARGHEGKLNVEAQNLVTTARMLLVSLGGAAQ